MKAMRNAQHEAAMRHELATAARSFLAGLPNKPPTVDDAMLRDLATIADIVTRARSPVVRDGFRRELEYAPEPEAPARLARQLHSLLQGVTIVSGRTNAEMADLARIARVARDCIPSLRWMVLAALNETGETLSTSDISAGAQYATVSVRRALEDLQALELVICHKEERGKADLWAVKDEWREILTTLTTFSEMSGDPSHKEECGPPDVDAEAAQEVF
jgi:hypothetical protein